jgi:hypothetical protein
MTRAWSLLPAFILVAAAPLGAEYRQIDLTIYGMD